uniref:POLR1E protein n=1 Tax=Fopius arisanus TaxID=64838 RepID=A0A0C9R1T9_9HYME
MKVDGIIEDVVIEPGKIQPIIVNFQNGQLKDTEARKMKSGIFHDEKKNKTVLAMSNGQVVYRGYRPDPTKELTYTMLAIHNRKTGKIRLIQAERWQVAPVLDREPERNDEIDGNRLMMLNRTFGSKKVKRRTEQYEKMKVNVEAVQQQLEDTVSKVEIDRDDLTPKIEDQSTADLPPCNRDATLVEDVYSLHDIIPKDLLKTLQSQIEYIETQERTSEFYLRTLRAIKASPQSEKKIAILEFIYSIVTWLSLPLKDAKKKTNEICPVSPEVSQYILETYSVNSTSGRLRPASVRDKALIHCIILSLMISGFKLDLEMFGSLITGRLGLKKLLELARIVGAMPTKNDKRLVMLRVPMPSAPTLVHRGKRKTM